MMKNFLVALCATCMLLSLAQAKPAKKEDPKALHKGCEQKKSATDCYRLGVHYEMKVKDKAKAVQYYTLGCELGSMSACHELALQNYNMSETNVIK